MHNKSQIDVPRALGRASHVYSAQGAILIINATSTTITAIGGGFVGASGQAARIYDA